MAFCELSISWVVSFSFILEEPRAVGFCCTLDSGWYCCVLVCMVLYCIVLCCVENIHTEKFKEVGWGVSVLQEHLSHS